MAKQVTIELDNNQLLSNTDFGWLMRLVNEKQSAKLLDYERQELTNLQAKLYSLDTAMVMAKRR